jgi:nucleosome assembly protein 1-like 1
MDDEEMEQRQMELESDYEMGIAFHERIVPHAIKWFTGEADDEDDGDDDYEEDEDEDGDLDVSFTC